MLYLGIGSKEKWKKGMEEGKMFYPAHLNIQERKCLVVGGGVVAERKVVSLLLSGGGVTLISPEATALLDDLAQIGQITWYKRHFQANDTDGMFLVSAATDLPEVNTQVFKEAYELNKIRLVNVVDVIPECTFAAASVVTLGNLVVSISTSGKSPAIARRIREHLEAKLGADSLYTEAQEEPDTVPIENKRLPYPVYLLLKNRRCVLIRTPGQMTRRIAQRVELLRRCGASVVERPPAAVRPDSLSDAFLILTNLESENALSADNRMPLVEHLNVPGAGTFITPLLVVDNDLIVSISTQSDEETDKAKAQQLQAELAASFGNSGYGAFINYLGLLRAAVRESIPTQEERQAFFDALIDRIPRSECGEEEKCCLGFTNANCTTECTFNWVRHGQVKQMSEYAFQQLKEAQRL
jgi:siroheme synthase-like protein